MSLTVSLLDIVRQEMQKHGAQKLGVVRVRCGAIANVVPEALSMAFEVLTEGTDLQGAKIEILEEPLRLDCGGCGQTFSPAANAAALFSPCPVCGEDAGHTVRTGKEMYIENIEVE